MANLAWQVDLHILLPIESSGQSIDTNLNPNIVTPFVDMTDSISRNIIINVKWKFGFVQ